VSTLAGNRRQRKKQDGLRASWKTVTGTHRGLPAPSRRGAALVDTNTRVNQADDCGRLARVLRVMFRTPDTRGRNTVHIARIDGGIRIFKQRLERCVRVRAA
jgi:hypothetical protein